MLLRCHWPIAMANQCLTTAPPRTVSELELIKAIPAEPNDESKKEGFKNFREKNTDEYLFQEYAYVSDVLEAIRIPMGFNHSDFQPLNMIINDDTGKVTFIDFEMSGFHYIARLLRSREMYHVAGAKTNDESDEKEVSPEARDLYAREYVKVQKEYEGLANEEVSNEEVELQTMEWRILDIMLKFQYMIMGLAFINLEFAKEINLLGIVYSARDDYGRKREELHELRDRYLALRNKIYSGRKCSRAHNTKLWKPRLQVITRDRATFSDFDTSNVALGLNSSVPGRCASNL